MKQCVTLYWCTYVAPRVKEEAGEMSIVLCVTPREQMIYAYAWLAHASISQKICHQFRRMHAPPANLQLASATSHE